MPTEVLPKDTAPAGTKQAPPCTLVIFGAGGDLTKRLLMPSLYNLKDDGLLDDGFSILGIDHLDLDDEGWRESLTETMQSFTKDPTAEFHVDRIDESTWGFIRDRLHYAQGDFLKSETFQGLAGRLTGNVIYYLAVPARFFGPIVDGLGEAQLLRQPEGSFRRVVIEKPFGADLPSAEALNARILKAADESQFYRIDHFLGKETVQSLMAIRFANGLFEPLWRREYVDHVEITAAETVGVEGRGAFYEATGALRDMVPNHLFTLLAMVAMEPPNSFDAEAVRDEKAKLMAAIRPIPSQDAVRGQYTAGKVDGVAKRDYRHEPDVAKDSATETYVALRLEIENWRWAGVPFYLRTGKHLAGRRTEIVVAFKPAPYLLFKGTETGSIAANIMRLQIDPVQGTQTQFNAKVPGPTMRLGKAETSFRYADCFPERPNVGYETLLYDCMIGDATLFQRADAIESAWAAVEPLQKAWGDGAGEGSTAIQPYASGTDGPDAADRLLDREGRRWLPLGVRDAAS
ncbi:glucose-6-phosphate dehydrogenase [Methylobacterium sp. E-046]|uniref:glucose-6-phosphate dehydrogenase n=1 Tax=Methylobacterium sp. E-046 TaxID=2836576 RepID=UPI001FBB6C2E|nr:glucose-6-phosphate dehydrogenase [Methylobacterium sp. E-046]MCJ2103503.1 glucose-6-phosphate dehydrogenase [Methylobacterium sp. E-046]